MFRKLAATPAFSKQPVGSGSVRFCQLDGLRGWAALSVVVFHIFWETFGIVAPGFRNPATGFFLDGELAVCIFFVLSGDALTSSVLWSRDGLALKKLAIKRYPRLLIPVLAAGLIMLALSDAGLLFNRAAAEIVKRPDWLGLWNSPPPTMGSALRFAFVDVFTKQFTGREMIPCLWTMQFELVGSVIVFLFLAFANRMGVSRLALASLIIACLWLGTKLDMTFNYYGCFLAGILFADLRHKHAMERLVRAVPALASGAAIVALGALDGWRNWQGFEDPKALIAIPLVAAIYLNRPALGFLGSALSRRLGRISFPLYLVQYPVLASLTSRLITDQGGSAGGLTYVAIWVIAVASLAACIVAAHCFEPVEHLTRWFGDRLVGLVVAPPARQSAVAPETAA